MPNEGRGAVWKPRGIGVTSGRARGGRGTEGVYWGLYSQSTLAAASLCSGFFCGSEGVRARGWGRSVSLRILDWVFRGRVERCIVEEAGEGKGRVGTLVEVMVVEGAEKKAVEGHG